MFVPVSVTDYLFTKRNNIKNNAKALETVSLQ